ncbi:DUF1501 domain-containing protein [Tundrisphaera lichenicola]|uniref:DUF1501 domain-containing protein n=1 Tax=Tundrisphaera lichenicola TaxID=2029860 RepID=UPI003EB8B619
MLRFLGPGTRLCDGHSRREILRVGGLGLLGAGLQLPDLARASGTSGDSSFGRAKSCIVLFLMGGPPQHSTWDPKPDAPAEVRGEFGPIDTKVPGLSISSLLPMTAQVADKLCLLRAVSTADNAHSSSGYYMLTGRPHQPQNVENANPGAPNDMPSLGALAGRVSGPRGVLPTSITLPHRIFNTDGSVWPGQDAGMLGRGADPWLLNAKLTPEGYKIQEIDLPADLDPARVNRRMGLIDGFRRGIDALDLDSRGSVFDDQTRRAYSLLQSPESRKAFRVEDEPQAALDRYGASPFGRSVLLARRLVEAGVRLVQVNWYRGADEPGENPCWDSHVREASRLKDVLVPPTDRAFSALIEDLDRRGTLDETLVVCMSEFGRTPRIEAGGGRGHWGSVFSIAMAGGGIKGGQVFGSSDKIGGQPRENRVRPEDLSATIFHCLGHTPDTEYLDRFGRPFPVSRGEVLHAIL